MPLRLQVVSVHRESMGGAYIHEFAACGGTIGRSLECDWPLPDSKRYISSRHAMIDYQGGAYYLVDLSRNGVYVNGSNTPVGQGNPQRLFDGDTLRLGEFEIKAALIEDAAERDSDGMADSIVRAQLVQEDESMEVSMLSPDQMNDGPSLASILTPGGGSGELSILTELPAAATAELHRAGQHHGLHEAAEAFIKAAGLNPRDYSGLDPLALLENAARLLAEFAEGTHALLAAKDSFTSRLNIAGSSAKAANPLRNADGIDTAMRLLLGNRNGINTTGTQAISAAFDELLQHQRAVTASMRNAAADHSEPKAFNAEFARSYEAETAE